MLIKFRKSGFLGSASFSPSLSPSPSVSSSLVSSHPSLSENQVEPLDVPPAPVYFSTRQLRRIEEVELKIAVEEIHLIFTLSN
jgi:hypothetical protein